MPLDPPTLLLHVSYPATYPDVAPDVDISLDASSPQHPGLTFPDDKSVLLDSLQETIADNLGMAMVFTLTSTLKEAAETLIHERAAAADREREEKARIEEEKDMEKFRGELVTKERFIEWRQRYLREKEEKKKKEEEDIEEAGKKGQTKNKVEEVKKLTGRQLWERGLAGGEGEDEDEGEDGTPDVAGLKVY